MRKTKITGLYESNEDLVLLKAPKGQEQEQIDAANKRLDKYKAAVLKDLKIGSKLLQQVKREDEKGEVIALPYFLWLNYFPNDEPLLILGSHPNVQKEFNKASVKPLPGQNKQLLSFGFIHLDENDVLQFVPDKIGAKIKPKPLVEALKKDTIKKSDIGFWGKRKVNNVIISQGEKVSEGTEQKQVESEVLSFTALKSKWVEEVKTAVEQAIKEQNYDQALILCNAYKDQVDAWLSLYSEEHPKEAKVLQRYQMVLGGFMVSIADKKAAQVELGIDDKEQNLSETPVTNVDRGQLHSEAYTKYYQFKKQYTMDSPSLRTSFVSEASKRMKKWIEELQAEFKMLPKEQRTKSSKEQYRQWINEVNTSRKELLAYFKKEEGEQSNTATNLITNLTRRFNKALNDYVAKVNSTEIIDPVDSTKSIAQMERLLLNAEDGIGLVQEGQEDIQRVVDGFRVLLESQKKNPIGPERRFWELVQVAKAAGFTTTTIPEQFTKLA